MAAAPRHALTAQLQGAIADALGEEHRGTDPLLAPSKSPAHDYQANFAMRLAKQLSSNPRELAQQVVDRMANGTVAEVAGPGFINLRVADDALARAATAVLRDDRLGVPKQPAQTVVVDYSAPNVAKEMHVGHLRSTVIGDAIARVLEFAGHRVIRQNHLGDYGTQFGMLTQHMLDTGTEHVPGFDALGELYRDAKQRFDTDPAFKEAARRRVVALQGGDPHTVALWRDLVDVSLEHINELYGRLRVTLTDEHLMGESAYASSLAGTVDALLELHVAELDAGAVIVPSERYTNPDGSRAVLIVRKSDGGYGYAATDLSAIRHRVTDLRADRLVYVTDARQAQHFRMVFDAAAKAGWLDRATAEHVPFGTMLGEDGRPFKTRTGGTVRLSDLLDEAVVRARAVVDAKNPGLTEAERDEIAELVGVGALKYADLSSARQRDLLFSFDRMLALDGSTAPYLLFAYVRATSILARAGKTSYEATHLTEPAERALVLKALEFPDAVADVADRLEPHKLATYLYELAGAATTFLEECPVLKANSTVRTSRLALCELTARTLGTGLDLLGIAVPRRM